MEFGMLVHWRAGCYADIQIDVRDASKLGLGVIVTC